LNAIIAKIRSVFRTSLKLSLLAAAVELEDRRFSDFSSIGKHIFSVAGKVFDIRKYYGYGCNCFQLGDTPLSASQVHGRPVDLLDNVCKKYKACQKCVRNKQGNECRGETVKYQLGCMTHNNE